MTRLLDLLAALVVLGSALAIAFLTGWAVRGNWGGMP